MTTWKHIMVGVDLADSSRNSIEKACTIARKFDARVSALNVTDAYPGEKAWPAVLAVKWREVRSAISEQHERALTKIIDEADTEPVEVSGEVVFGATSLKLTKSAEDQNADLLVVSSGNRSRVERALIGSTAENLIKQATVPVWVSRSDPGPVRRILVAVDYSPASTEAVRLGGMLSEAFNATVELVHAYRDPGEAKWFTVADPEDLARYRKESLEKERGDFAAFEQSSVPSTLRSSHHYRSALIDGRAWKSIVAHAEETSADLVVIGSRGHHYLHRLFLGSTASKVARHAACDVLIVGPPKGA